MIRELYESDAKFYKQSAEERNRSLAKQKVEIEEIIKRTSLSNIVSRNSNSTNELRARKHTQDQPVTNIIELDVGSDQVPDFNEGVKLHRVTPNDTLEGLCLRYSISVGELKRANKIYNNQDLFISKYLVIPQKVLLSIISFFLF